MQQEDVVAASPTAIYVFAGNDRTVCLGQSLLIQSLQATINGDVNDGDWISYGDGRFQPGNLQTVRYSVAQAQQIEYVPGQNDLALGFYRLLLLSDVPVGKPLERESDEVKITFQTAPPLFCSSNFTIALNESCLQKVDATMLQSNPVPPFTNYIVELYTKDGKLIPDNTLTKDHVGKEISYKLGHQCTSNVCYGSFFVDDYFPPVFDCKNDTVQCNSLITPEAIGFPFPAGAWIDTIIGNKFIVKDWDKCSDVTLEYTDTESKGDCTGSADRTITRKWKAKDVKGNTSNCTEIIVVKRMPLDAVTFPANYDGKQNPFFECGDVFPVLDNGYPSPDTTGIPGVGYCGHLQFQYSDIVFEECGHTYKIARNWFVIDWCTSENRTSTQLIYMKDSKAPHIISVDTMIVATSPYTCATDLEAIPALREAVDCSAFSLDYKLKNALNQNFDDKIQWVNNKAYFKNLPVGNYILTYEATDVCGNRGETTSMVIVKDETPPYPVCSAHTKVSLDNIGNGRTFAFSFDNGSSDNCAIDYFKVRRMDNACGKSLAWNDYVDFCCADIGTTQMVVFHVTDIYGNNNTCMVEVNVEDKIKPTIICPPNITLACTDDYDIEDLDKFGKVVTTEANRRDIHINNYYHQGFVGRDGLASDNCTVSVQYRYTTDISCHTGHIYRTFIAEDASGNVDSCIQVITILNPNPFTVSDITWPKAYDGSGCKNIDASPSITGEPVFKNTACGHVTSNYTDQNFYLADSACVKILRTWSVVDWCQFDQDHPKEGIHQYIQTIKLSNFEAPQMLSSCQDTSFCSYAADCGLTAIELKADAADECTSKQELVWTYEVDIDSDGSIDYTGNVAHFSAEVPMGRHKIKWTVSDQCGNITQCTRVFFVKDCKKPTPYCITSLTKSLDAVTGTVEISAKDFDNGSSDNCTALEDLIFTFDRAVPVKSEILNPHYFKGDGYSATRTEYLLGDAQWWDPETRSSSILLDCDDIPDGIAATIALKMSVTDLNGYSDYCEIELILQDNSDVCPDVVSSHFVGGAVKLGNDRFVQGVEVHYRTSESDGYQVVNSEGKYLFTNLERGKAHTFEPYYNEDVLEGISTMDLVLIQRHILGLEYFTSPYQHIAADVDDSKYITASDITRIRRLILGKATTFPNNRASWVFVAKDGIKDPALPLQFESQFETKSLMSDLNDVDFVAVKLGDVNYSAPVDDFRHDKTETRLAPYVVQYYKEITNHQVKWVFVASERVDVDALQFGVQFQNSSDIERIVWNEALGFEKDANIDEHLIRLVMYHAVPIEVRAGNVLFELYTSDDADNHELTLSKNFQTELYENGSRRPVTISALSKLPQSQEVKLLNNPVSSQLVLVISSIAEDLLNYEIIGSDGRAYQTGIMNISALQGEYPIDLSPNLIPGIYFIRVYGKSVDSTLKFIQIH